MKTLISVLLLGATGAAFALGRNTQKDCYRIMDPDTKKTGKAAVVMSNSNGGWDVLIDQVVTKARVACKDGVGFGSCIDDFLARLESCDGVVHTQSILTHIAEIKRSAEAHATHSARPVEVSAEQGNANK